MGAGGLGECRVLMGVREYLFAALFGLSAALHTICVSRCDVNSSMRGDAAVCADFENSVRSLVRVYLV